MHKARNNVNRYQITFLPDNGFVKRYAANMWIIDLYNDNVGIFLLAMSLNVHCRDKSSSEALLPKTIFIPMWSTRLDITTISITFFGF